MLVNPGAVPMPPKVSDSKFVLILLGRCVSCARVGPTKAFDRDDGPFSKVGRRVTGTGGCSDL
jgi:hypothetical protein